MSAVGSVCRKSNEKRCGERVSGAGAETWRRGANAGEHRRRVSYSGSAITRREALCHGTVEAVEIRRELCGEEERSDFSCASLAGTVLWQVTEACVPIAVFNRNVPLPPLKETAPHTPVAMCIGAPGC